ncbi:MAG: PEP-CTERM sorting domain-containing protein [Planctomycetota bacterium]|nr:PEP-CTERM sorting domain-containing protein [Planctomycetota bacterium]
MKRRIPRHVLVSLAALCWLVLVWACPLKAQADVIVPDPSLPPVAGWYEGDPLSQVADYTIAQATDIRMSNFRNIFRTNDGDDELLNFDVTLTAMASMGGVPGIPVSFDGPLTVRVFDKAGNTTGNFDAEIVSANCTGSIGPVIGIIRENLTLASTGQIEITDLGGGLYNIDSFFDIFTELSVDGGQSFSPDVNAPHRMVLVPEPATLMLLVAGGMVMIRRRRRRV